MYQVLLFKSGRHLCKGSIIGFVADLFFSSLESGFIFFRIRCRICRMRVDGSRIRKRLRIRKYLDTRGRGLNLFFGDVFVAVVVDFPIDWS